MIREVYIRIEGSDFGLVCQVWSTPLNRGKVTNAGNSPLEYIIEGMPRAAILRGIDWVKVMLWCIEEALIEVSLIS